MAGWAGFTDADLVKLKGPSAKADKLQYQENSGEANNNKNAKLAQSSTKPNVKKGRPLKEGIESGSRETALNLNPEERLSKPQPSHNNQHANNKRTELHEATQRSPLSTPINDASKSITKYNIAAANTDAKVSDNATVSLANTTIVERQGETPKEEIKELEVDEILSREHISLEEFRKRQKMIEERNKQQRAMLADTIKQRQKRTKAESAKLAEIQAELNILDELLTVDVSIIRDKIEDASREYLEAQKRYDRAEKEFVEAKIALHKRVESKEQLTEHLYTVIHQNEVRKAKKLAELMQKLDMEGSLAEDIAGLALVCPLPQPTLGFHDGGPLIRSRTLSGDPTTADKALEENCGSGIASADSRIVGFGFPGVEKTESNFLLETVGESVTLSKDAKKTVEVAKVENAPILEQPTNCGEQAAFTTGASKDTNLHISGGDQFTPVDSQDPVVIDSNCAAMEVPKTS